MQAFAQLAAPSIVDQGARHRPWRLPGSPSAYGVQERRSDSGGSKRGRRKVKLAVPHGP